MANVIVMTLPAGEGQEDMVERWIEKHQGKVLKRKRRIMQLQKAVNYMDRSQQQLRNQIEYYNGKATTVWLVDVEDPASFYEASRAIKAMVSPPEIRQQIQQQTGVNDEGVYVSPPGNGDKDAAIWFESPNYPQEWSSQDKKRVVDEANKKIFAALSQLADKYDVDVMPAGSLISGTAVDTAPADIDYHIRVPDNKALQIHEPFMREFMAMDPLFAKLKFERMDTDPASKTDWAMYELDLPDDMGKAGFVFVDLEAYRYQIDPEPLIGTIPGRKEEILADKTKYWNQYQASKSREDKELYKKIKNDWRIKNRQYHGFPESRMSFKRWLQLREAVRR